MPVRTKLLASGRLTTSSLVLVYTVPTGETTIVKRLVLANLSTSASALVTVAMDATGFDRTMWLEDTLQSRKTINMETWQVLAPGFEIALQGPGTPAVNYWISGTELEGVAD